MEQQTFKPMLNAPEVATILGVSRNTVYGLVSSGLLTGVRVSNRMRFDRDEIEDFLRRNRTSSR